jgi:hypothetical protein
MADPVVEKDRRNFCEYFQFSREPFAAAGSGGAKQAEARAKLDALFGGKGAAGGTGASDARKKLDALFGKKPPDDDD